MVPAGEAAGGYAGFVLKMKIEIRNLNLLHDRVSTRWHQ